MWFKSGERDKEGVIVELLSKHCPLVVGQGIDQFDQWCISSFSVCGSLKPDLLSNTAGFVSKLA